MTKETKQKTNIKFHGRTFEGVVTSSKMQKTVVISFERRKFLPKYERYEKKRTQLKAHNPESLNAQEGDSVIVQETRPLSKTKHFIVTQVLGKARGYEERKTHLEESKKRKEVVEETAKEKEIVEEAKEESNE
ncbi:MAG: 30S ribosomal protein S17 [Nanoarchaeota archaeon]|nr:30S ribosomal protein S17 [Nanoarchaeota archaeon]